MNKIQRLILDRKSRTKLSGSPQYVYNIGVIPFGTYIEIDVNTHFPASKKYAPLTNCVVVNNDVVDLIITLNGAGNSTFLVPANTIAKIAEESIWQLRVLNNDPAVDTTADLSRVSVYRTPETADQILREQR